MPTIFFLILFYYIFQHLFFLRWLQYSINFRHIHIWINNRHHYTITSQLVCEHTRTPYFSRVLFFFFWQQRSFVKESFRHNKWFLFDFQGWIEVLVFVWQKSLKFLKFFFFPFCRRRPPHTHYYNTILVVHSVEILEIYSCQFSVKNSVKSTL